MKKFKVLGLTLFTWGEETDLLVKPTPKVIQSTLPSGRVSEPIFQSGSNSFAFNYLKNNLQVITPEFNLEVIPLLRKLVKTIPEFSQALDNIVRLGNTGHEVFFDASVEAAQVNKMRAHLLNKQKIWARNEGNMQGLVDKLIAQIMISGALAMEWVPDNKLMGIETPVLVNPETIRWVFNKTKQKYIPYQLQPQAIGKAKEDSLYPLNQNTFVYYGINGDTELPYGIPCYIAALEAAGTQKLMLDNLNFLVEQLGLMGFLEIKVAKPDNESSSSDAVYEKSLDNYLIKVKDRAKEGMRDGTIVGFKDDHEFQFHSTTKEVNKVPEIFQLNNLQLASGIKMDSSMLGRNYGTTETQITVVFAKMLSQLSNIQNLLSANLEFGYSLELRLAGFKFDNLTVKFKPPSALDKLKEEQAEEIKIRNSNALYNAGIIGQDQYAHRHGLEKPNEEEPRFVANGDITPEEAKQKRADQKAKDKKNKTEKDQRVKKTIKNGVKLQCINCEELFTIEASLKTGDSYCCPHCEKEAVI